MNEPSLEDALRARYADRASAGAPSILRTRLMRIPELEGTGAPRWLPARRQGQRALVFRVMLVAAALLALLLATLATVGQQPGPPTFAADSIAFTQGGDLYVAGADGQGARLLASVDTAKGDAIGYFSFSPDQRHLAYEIQDDIGPDLETRIVDADGRPVGSFPDLMKHSSWAPDGRSLAVFSFDHGVSIVGLDGTQLRDLPLPEADYDLAGSRRVAWSPDGRWIAVSACRDLPASNYCKFDHDWLLVATDGSGSHWLGEPTGPTTMGTLAWASDSRVALAVGGRSKVVQVLSPDTGLLDPLYVPQSSVLLAWWSPDASRLLLEGHDADAWGLVIADTEARSSTVLATDPVVLDGPAGWSGDGQRVLFLGSVGTGPRGAAMGDTGPADARGLWSIDATGNGTSQLLIADADPAWFAVASLPLGRFPQ